MFLNVVIVTNQINSNQLKSTQINSNQLKSTQTALTSLTICYCDKPLTISRSWLCFRKVWLFVVIVDVWAGHTNCVWMLLQTAFGCFLFFEKTTLFVEYWWGLGWILMDCCWVSFFVDVIGFGWFFRNHW